MLDKNLPWTDASFAFPESITWKDLPQDMAFSIADDVKTIDWLRLSDDDKFDQYSMWGFGKVTPDDSIQGALGKCWLVAASSSIADDP